MHKIQAILLLNLKLLEKEFLYILTAKTEFGFYIYKRNMIIGIGKCEKAKLLIPHITVLNLYQGSCDEPNERFVPKKRNTVQSKHSYKLDFSKDIILNAV